MEITGNQMESGKAIQLRRQRKSMRDNASKWHEANGEDAAIDKACSNEEHSNRQDKFVFGARPQDKTGEHTDITREDAVHEQILIQKKRMEALSLLRKHN